MNRKKSMLALAAFSFASMVGPSAQAVPLDVAVITLGSPSFPNCVFDLDCTIFVTDTSQTISTTGGVVQSRRFPVGEPGTPGAGYYAHVYRVNLAQASAGAECVREIAIPFGGIQPFDFDGDGLADDLWESTVGLGNVSIDSAELPDDTLVISFAGSGVCQGAFPGDGDSSYFFGVASRFDGAFKTADLDFHLSAPNESIIVRAPDFPTTAAMEDYAFAWANQESSALYNPSPLYSYNRAGGGIQVERTGVGNYRVVFEGMDTLWNVHGNAQVTAYGSGFIDDAHCNTPGWGANYVDVQCFDNTGNLTDSRFNVLLAKPMPIREGVAYVRADQPTASSYQPPAEQQNNPGGGPTTVSRLSQGRYSVTFTGFGGPQVESPGSGGNVQVTSMSSGSARCRVSSWSYSTSNVQIQCLDTSGLPVDAEFSLLWLLPDERFDRDISYAWSNVLATSFFEPSAAYASNPADGAVWGSWSTTGRYVIEFDGLSTLGGVTEGHVQVTAYGAGSARCEIRSWQPETNFVDCFDPTGAPVNSRFSLLRLDSTPVPEPSLALSLLVGAFAVAGGCGARRREA